MKLNKRQKEGITMLGVFMIILFIWMVAEPYIRDAPDIEEWETEIIYSVPIQIQGSSNDTIVYCDLIINSFSNKGTLRNCRVINESSRWN